MDVAVNKEEKKKGYDSYELESAVRTLLEAEEIKADRKLMEAIQPLLTKKTKAIKSIADLRSIAKEKRGEEEA